MPQLEQFDTYIGQMVWLIVTFGVLYLIMWKAALPRVADVLQERQERIDDDLRRAEDLKKEAQSILDSYEAAVAAARSQAQIVLRQSADSFAEEAAGRHETLRKRLDEETARAESRIDASRRQALANIRSLATEVAQAATARLVELDVPQGEADAAVADALKERG